MMKMKGNVNMFGRNRKSKDLDGNFREFSHEVFENGNDSAESLTMQAFIDDLENKRYTKIDKDVEMLVDKDENIILFRKIDTPDTAYTFDFTEDEMYRVLASLTAMREGLFKNCSLSSNGITLELCTNAKGQAVVSVIRDHSTCIKMVSANIGLYRRMIYVLLYGLLN